MQKKEYPKMMYRARKDVKPEHEDQPHLHYDTKTVHSEDDEKKLGGGWHDSPADLGIETHPGSAPDEDIVGKGAGSGLTRAGAAAGYPRPGEEVSHDGAPANQQPGHELDGVFPKHGEKKDLDPNKAQNDRALAGSDHPAGKQAESGQPKSIHDQKSGKPSGK